MPIRPISGREKALMLLSLLESQGSERIMQFLSPESAEKIAGGVGDLPKPTPGGLEEIFREVSEEFGEAPGITQATSRSPLPQKESHPVQALVQRYQNEKPHILAFVAGELPPEDQEYFLSQLGEKRREIEPLIRQRRKSPLTESIRQTLIHGPH